MRLRKTSSFIPNQWYRISDFRTRWQSHLTGTVHEGGIEPLLVQAVTRNRLALRAYSERHPYDEIEYIIYDGSLHGERKNGKEVPSNDRGGIVWRKDINRNIECGFDFRAYTVRLFETSPGSGVFRHYGAGPAYVDRHLFDLERSHQVFIGKGAISWVDEDGTVHDNKGFGNPEHYMNVADKVQIGRNSFNIKIYGQETTNGVFGECTDDILVEGDWVNSQMLGFNNTVTFGGSVGTSFFLGGMESATVDGNVLRSTFLPGIAHATFQGSLSDCIISSLADGKTYDGDRSGEFIGQLHAEAPVVEDAPRDGKSYVRKDGRWIEIEILR